METNRSERGQGLVEYTLIFVLVALVLIVIFHFFGPTLSNVYFNVIGLF